MLNLITKFYLFKFLFSDKFRVIIKNKEMAFICYLKKNSLKKGCQRIK